MSNIVFNIVSEIFLGFKISNKICLCIQSGVYFVINKQQVKKVKQSRYRPGVGQRVPGS